MLGASNAAGGQLLLFLFQYLCVSDLWDASSKIHPNYYRGFLLSPHQALQLHRTECPRLPGYPVTATGLMTAIKETRGYTAYAILTSSLYSLNPSNNKSHVL